MSRVKFEQSPNRDIPEEDDLYGASSATFGAARYPFISRLSLGRVCKRHQETHDTTPRDATWHITRGGGGTNTWFSTDGGRHTDGKDEQTARRRTRSLQSLPRRWRWRWRKSGGCGERKGFRAPPPPPPPPLPSPLPPPSTPLPRQKGMSDSISKGARTRIMHVAGLDRGER